jgi:DNA-binding NarL/FixJ family response regulator
MWMISAGKSITHIAEELFLIPNTVSTYRIRILRKLKLENNAELIRYAIKHQLME